MRRLLTDVNIKAYFDNIPHEKLMAKVAEKIRKPRHLLEIVSLPIIQFISVSCAKDSDICSMPI
jgi:retron-type reverse transcriptase